MTRARAADAITSTGSTRCSRSGVISWWWTTPGVGTIDVGDSTFTRTLSACTSAASPVVNRSSAAFTIPYTVPPGPVPNGGPSGWMAPFDEMLRMAPQRRARMPGSTSWASSNGART